MDGQLFASTGRRISDARELAEAVQALAQTPRSGRFIAHDGFLYRIVLQPLPAAGMLGYALVGFAVDGALVEELTQLISLDVSFLANDQGLLISSLDAADSVALNRLLSSEVDHLLLWSRPHYISRNLDLPSLAAEPVTITLTASLPKIYAEFDRVLQLTLLWTVVTLIIGLLAALMLSRTLIIPLQQLVWAAKKFAVGDYRSYFNTSSSTSAEVRDLQQAFADMGRQIQAREKQVSFQARHDILTELYNRSTMLEAIAGQIHQQRPFLLIASNIREFKSINDNLGPQIGDRCLRVIAQRLLQKSSNNGSLHARLGGDEFISLIPLLKPDDAEQTAQDLMALMRQPVVVQELSLKLRFCMGLCIFPEDGSDAKTLVRRTIIALENARKQGVALRTYQAGEDEAHLERLAIVDSLNKAMHADDGQLLMYYQPKLNLKTGRIDKVESLIRWHRPDHGWMSPEVFIGLAEQAGLIVELTQWVVRKVLGQLQAWDRQKVHMNAAINISAQDLLYPDFVPFLKKAVRAHHISPSRVTLELTERDLMRDEQQGLLVLERLQNLGFVLSVDDYGIGQSSLGKLKKLPVTELKIDKSFILKLDSSPTDQMIVQSTITLGHNLNLSVVAEGVENEQSLELLRKMGVDHIQGYYLCRPIAPESFTDWLAEHRDMDKQA